MSEFFWFMEKGIAVLVSKSEKRHYLHKKNDLDAAGFLSPFPSNNLFSKAVPRQLGKEKENL